MFDQISIILVSTSHPGNIGAVARAMKNMGLENLILVNPKEFPHAEATARAAGADDILAKAKIVNSLLEAVSSCHFVVGTSARHRTVPWPLSDPRQCVEKITPMLNSGLRVAFVFGNEQSGLSNDELSLCHSHLHIPCEENFSSLNVAAAAQIVTYELRMMMEQQRIHSENDQLRALGNNKSEHVLGDTQELSEHEKRNKKEHELMKGERLATAGEVEQFYAHLEQLLMHIGYLKPSNPGKLMLRLRRLFNRAIVEENEIHILRGILNTIASRTKENN